MYGSNRTVINVLHASGVYDHGLCPGPESSTLVIMLWTRILLFFSIHRLSTNMDIILLLPASLRSFPRYEAGCCEQYVRRVITGSYRIAELSLIEF